MAIEMQVNTDPKSKIDLETLKNILESNTLNNEIDFVLSQLKLNGCCRQINPFPTSQKYNLPYDSKLTTLISILENERVL